MAIEIERKFLLSSDQWRELVTKKVKMQQGYLATSANAASVRVRIVGDKANLNIKSATLELFRHEYEYPIPIVDAQEMLEHLCETPLIEKIRHYVSVGNHVWEIDEFSGDNAGLIVAEVELQHVDEKFDKPQWLGDEVTQDKRYYNVCLVRHPYKQWK